MNLGRIEGVVWATVKDERLRGVRLDLMQPVNENRQPVGGVVVAVDTVGAGEGDIVVWVNSTEAAFVLSDRAIPTEISIVALVDRLDVNASMAPVPEDKEP